LRVLDASAVLAMIQNETGQDVVRNLIEGSKISSVNFAEIATRLLDLQADVDNLAMDLKKSRVKIVSVDTDLALAAAKLRSSTRHKGLSLADRICLALAIREQAIAITADRAWADLNIGCEIELIR